MWGVWGLEVGKLGDARVLLGMSGRRECWRFGWIFAFLMLSLQLLSLNLEEICREHTLRSEVLNFLI
jgi:hypothetical protein